MIKPNIEKPQEFESFLSWANNQLTPIYLLGAKFVVSLDLVWEEESSFVETEVNNDWVEIHSVFKGQCEIGFREEQFLENGEKGLWIFPKGICFRKRIVEAPFCSWRYCIQVEGISESGILLIEKLNSEIIKNKMFFKFSDYLKLIEKDIIGQMSGNEPFPVAVAKWSFLVRLFFVAFLGEFFPDAMDKIASNCGEKGASSSNDRDPAAAIRLYILNNIFGALYLDDIAEKFNISTRHLNRIFKSRYGCSVGNFIQERKIEKACELLRQTSRTVKDIAYSLGYQDVGYFCRYFNKRKDMTPTAFRNSGVTSRG